MKEITLLIPNEFMGSVIGAGGRSIRRLMFQASTTIKCADADDLYPGTNSRKVCTTYADYHYYFTIINMS
jgi:hypothetical protein